MIDGIWHCCINHTMPGHTSILGTHNFVRPWRTRAAAKAYGPNNRDCDQSSG